MSWLRTLRIQNEVIKHSDLHNTIEFNTNIELYQHQKIVLRSMIEFEQSCTIDLIYKNVKYTLYANEGLLNDPINSGRSVIILSLIKYNNVIQTFNNKYKADCRQSVIITKNYKKWIINNKQIGLNIFVIRSITNLRKFIQLQNTNCIDVILIQNSKTTEKTVENKFIVNLFSTYTKRRTWRRVIIDDFDVISLPSKFYKIKSLFTWYISYKYNSQSNTLVNIDTSVNNKIHYINKPDADTYNVNKYINNNIFINYITITSKPRLLLFSLKFNIQIIKYLINSLNSDYDINIPAFSDLNVDSLKLLSILYTECDVFSGLFNDVDLISYYKIKKILNFITKNKAKLDRLPYLHTFKYNESELSKMTPITHINNNMVNLLNECEYKYNKLVYNIDNIINRINNASDECSICCYSFERSNCIIYKCCNYLSCSNCYVRIFKCSKTATACPFCRHSAKFLNNILVVDQVSIFKNLKNLNILKYCNINSTVVKDVSILNILNNIISKTNVYSFNIISTTVDYDVQLKTYSRYTMGNQSSGQNKIIIIGLNYMQLYHIYKQFTEQSVLISDFYTYDISKIMNNKFIKCIFSFNTTMFTKDTATLTNDIDDIIIIGNGETECVFDNSSLLNIISLCNKFNSKKINVHGIIHSSSSLSNSRLDVNDGE